MRSYNEVSCHQSFYRYIAALCVVLGLSACGGASPIRDSHSDVQYAALERRVFEETNALRSAPADFATILKGQRQRFSGKIYYRENNPVGIITMEGVKAIDEATAVLDTQQPVPSLLWSDELAALAREHVVDTGQKGMTGHDSSSGKNFSQRVASLNNHPALSLGAENISYGFDSGRGVVLQLVVDDGVPSRGHRSNILMDKLRYSGVGCGYHRKYTVMCVVIYAFAS